MSPYMQCSNSTTLCDVFQPQDGTEAFLPYLSHIIGQPASGTAPGSGILGCLAHKDWAVRKAAGDTLKTAVIVLGPQIEPEGVWDVDSPASLTGRCLQGLEGAKFDKVSFMAGKLKVSSSSWFARLP